MGEMITVDCEHCDGTGLGGCACGTGHFECPECHGDFEGHEAEGPCLQCAEKGAEGPCEHSAPAKPACGHCHEGSVECEDCHGTAEAACVHCMGRGEVRVSLEEYEAAWEAALGA